MAAPETASYVSEPDSCPRLSQRPPLGQVVTTIVPRRGLQVAVACKLSHRVQIDILAELLRDERPSQITHDRGLEVCARYRTPLHDPAALRLTSVIVL
jgi:hypothetical protein